MLYELLATSDGVYSGVELAGGTTLRPGIGKRMTKDCSDCLVNSCSGQRLREEQTTYASSAGHTNFVSPPARDTLQSISQRVGRSRDESEWTVAISARGTIVQSVLLRDDDMHKDLDTAYADSGETTVFPGSGKRLFNELITVLLTAKRIGSGMTLACCIDHLASAPVSCGVPKHAIIPKGAGASAGQQQPHSFSGCGEWNL
jgi:hypothetical protein